MKIRFLVFVLISCFLSSCDLSTEANSQKGNEEVEITGTIIDESTGSPISNLVVSLKEGSDSGLGSWGFYNIVDSDTSNENGSFQLYLNSVNSNELLQVQVNNESYNSKYSTSNFTVKSGDILEKEIKLYQNTSLTVELKSENPLNDHEFTLWLPGTGTSIGTSHTTNRAKGNFYNIVRLNYSRNGEPMEIIDSVYCPIDTTTFYVLDY